MNEKAIEAIKGRINASLKRCEVLVNWPQYDSFSEHVDSLAKEVLKHKSSWIDRNDVYSIFYDLVYKYIISKIEKNEEYSGLLINLKAAEDLEELCDSMCNYYLSIPRQYSVFVPLPKLSKKLDIKLRLSSSIEIVSFNNTAEIPGGFKGGLLSAFFDKLEINKVYLKFNMDGYCNNREDNKIVKESLEFLKIIVHQGLYKEILSEVVEENSHGLSSIANLTHHRIPKSNFICIDQLDKDEKIISVEVPLEICRLINSIDFNWANARLKYAFEIGQTDEVLKNYLDTPALLIESNEPESRKVKSAIIWCFDSKVTTNETLSFLQICIGLESLLGDDESNGNLTETLADRCSYLIGNNIRGRRSIKEKFIELYRIRSKIVHGVTAELANDKRFYKHWGQSVLEFAISKEIKHLELKQESLD